MAANDETLVGPDGWAGWFGGKGSGREMAYNYTGSYRDGERGISQGRIDVFARKDRLYAGLASWGWLNRKR